MKALLFSLLVVGHVTAAQGRLPSCSLNTLGQPALFATLCLLQETGEPVKLEEGEQLLGFVFSKSKLPHFTKFLNEAKQEIQEKFDRLPNKETLQIEPVHLKVTYHPDLSDDPYIGSVTAKVVAKAKKAAKAGVTFSYTKRFDHEPTEVEKQDVSIEAAKQFPEMIKWTGLSPKMFAVPSKPKALGIEANWEITVNLKLK